MKEKWSTICSKNETTFGQQKVTFWLGKPTGFCHFVFFFCFFENGLRFLS